MSENINEIAGVEPSFKIDELKFNEKGLIPAIVQDHYSKKVLMMAWMNRESLEISLREKKTCFYSRSRQTGENIKPGDKLIGIASSGVHSNGFSLVRKVFEMTEESLNTYYDELGKTLGEALLAPTRIYVKALKKVKEAGVTIKGCSHITGGGFYENIPRMLPDGVKAVVKKDSYEVPAIFKLLAKTGDIEEEMMYNTYNMGIGMVLAIDPADVDKTMEALKAAGETCYELGQVESGEKCAELV